MIGYKVLFSDGSEVSRSSPGEPAKEGSLSITSHHFRLRSETDGAHFFLDIVQGKITKGLGGHWAASA